MTWEQRLARRDPGIEAQSRGRCAQCLKVIEVGQAYWWDRGTPPLPECQACRRQRFKEKEQVTRP